MFQQDALLPWKTCVTTSRWGWTLGGVPRSGAHARADAWLTRVGWRHSGPLSVAVERRHAQACRDGAELDHRSRHVLMDEPFSALDVHTRQQMKPSCLRSGMKKQPQRAQRCREERFSARSAISRLKKTVVFVTHDLEEASSLADESLSCRPAPPRTSSRSMKWRSIARAI